MDRYMFPALFEPGDKKGYCVTFPDLPGCVTEGDSLEEDGDPVPSPTAPDRIAVPERAFVSLVEVWMPLVRDEMQNKAVKRTLTIPKWLNDIAERNKVNFSRLLQAALKNYLGVPTRK